MASILHRCFTEMSEQDDVPIIGIEHASKIFNGKSAVKDVTFDVYPGQIFGLIGPSGSGKTTLVHMMVGVNVPTTGYVRVLGVEPSRFTARTRELLGYMSQNSFLYPNLTVWENLSYVAGLYGVGPFKKRKVIRRTLEKLHLWDDRKKLASDLSGGMMRRLQLGAALVHDPALALIDEPMEGLDPLLRQEVWEILDDLRAQSKTVLMTTHNMNEAERCDALALMAEGELLATGTPKELRERVFGGEIVRLQVDRIDSETYGALQRIPTVRQINIFGADDVRLVTEYADATLPKAVEAMRSLNVGVLAAERYQPPFDEVFSRLVRHV